MKQNWVERLRPRGFRRKRTYLQNIVTGSMYRVSDMYGNSSISDIHTQIDTMRALARDSQISTTLSYYATDATVPNSSGQIIWAIPSDGSSKAAADVINDCFKRWNINEYVRDHMLELATIGNLYLPTTDLYKSDSLNVSTQRVALDNNTIPSASYDIIPSYKILPENVVHLYYQGNPEGFILDPDETRRSDKYIYPDQSIIHFSLGGLLGDYTLDVRDSNGDDLQYDIKFGQPMLDRAVTPTQTLNLLEDAILLNSLIRTVRFINVECGDLEDTEVLASLTEMKNVIEQQLSLNTSTGDTQSFVNPQSPNNLIYLPMFNGQAPVTITDLNLAETNDTDSKLLDYYENKKLSVLGLPKEALNFSSAEGLGGAGAVMSQRSELYANCLQRLQTAYKSGWTDGMNKYFIARGMPGLVNKFQLEMSPILTQMSTVVAEQRDSAISQALQMVELLKSVGVKNTEVYERAIQEILKGSLPLSGGDAVSWKINLTEGDKNEY